MLRSGPEVPDRLRLSLPAETIYGNRSAFKLHVSNPSKSVVMVGLHGVGKTVLLDQMRKEAVSIRFELKLRRTDHFLRCSLHNVGKPCCA